MAARSGCLDRVAVVTGASRGLGLAVARALAGAGARVAMLARGAEALGAAASEIAGLAVPCDVGDPRAIETALGTVASELGETDILVNNAGAFRLAAVERTDPAELRETVDVNLLAPILLSRAVLPAMHRRRHGHIVHLGSIADHTTFPENAAYAASKHGLRAFHEVLRTELRGSGVRTTLVSPGPVDTPLWDPIDPDARAGFTPRASMLTAADVAAAVLWAVMQPPAVNVDVIRISHA